MDAQKTRDLRKETQPVVFPEWEVQLVSLGLDEAQTEAMRRSIVGLLARCKAQRVPVSIAIARQHLEEKGPGVIRREALRWLAGTPKMDLYSQADFDGKEEALRVARSGTRSLVSDGEEKVLSFFLMPGGCDARISKDPAFEVRFSWLNNRRPSTYFARLAPGLLSQLMDLGGVSTIQDIAEFSIGPGSTGKSRYRTSFEKKWIRISCSDDEILICVRSSPTDLDTPLEYEKKRANQSPETRPTSRPVSA